MPLSRARLSLPRPIVLSALARRALLLLAVAAPFLSCWIFIDAYALPARLQSQVLRLDGNWKLQEGDDTRWAEPALDDSAWKEIRLPGGYSTQGYQASRAWARRRFDLPPALQGQPLLFTLGGLRSGKATLFVNGREVGRTDDHLRGLKGEIEGLEAWEIDSRELRPGSNVLALRFEWGVLGDDGISDARLFLGASEHLRPYYLRASDTRRLFQSGALVLFGFMLVLLGTFWIQESDRAHRALQGSTFFLVASAALYLVIRTGTFLPLTSSSPATYAVLVSAVVLFVWALLEFFEQYCLGRVTLVRKAHRALSCATIAAFIVAYSVGQVPWLPRIYGLFAIYTFVALVYPLALTLRTVRRRRRAADLVIMSAIFCILATGAVDLLADLYVLQSPRLFSLAITGLGLCAGAILIADFIKLSYVNKELSTTLTQTNAELGVALARAEEAARLKNELLANVSHELRTPLNSIINLPQGLLPGFIEQPGARCQACGSAFELEPGDSVEPHTPCPSCGALSTLQALPLCRFEGELAEVPRHLRIIHRNGTQLLRLINDVLDLSHLESGKLTLRPETVIVSQLWSELHDAMMPLANPRNISLRFAPVEPALILRADPVKLSQILVNLLGNAIKFSSPGSTVTLTGTQEGEFLVFCVRDQGIGIAPEHHSIIFESFRQVDGSHTRRFGGTGLGLSITRKLVELHQGTLWLESAPGQGSSFFVRLPRGESVSLPLAARSTA
jgi:signal transduction histidine kinase